METKDLFARLSDLRITWRIRSTISMETGEKFVPEEVVIRDPNDPDEVGKWDAMQEIMYHLEYAFDLIKYLESPICDEGILHKKENERYNLNGLEITSGAVIEILDDTDEKPKWVRTAIEHNGSDYYAVRVKGPLEGKRARYRNVGR